jgi:hypothetical protein
MDYFNKIKEYYMNIENMIENAMKYATSCFSKSIRIKKKLRNL